MKDREEKQVDLPPEHQPATLKSPIPPEVKEFNLATTSGHPRCPRCRLAEGQFDGDFCYACGYAS